MTERRKTLTCWCLAIAGLVVTLLTSAGTLHNLEVEGEPPTVEQPAVDATYPIPDPVPRRTGIALSRPFLFSLSDSDKVPGLQREQKLKDRYQAVLDHLDGRHLPLVEVSTELGVAIVMIDGRAFVTVLPQDCPEYFARLDDAGKLKLQAEVASAWARVIRDDLSLQNIKRNPTNIELFNIVTALAFFLTCMAHLTISWISQRFLKSPLWSLKLLLWVAYFTVLTALHPALDDLAHALTYSALQPITSGIFIAVAVALLHQGTQFAVRRYLDALSNYSMSASVRAELRRQTLEQAWTFVSRVSWTFLGICLFLQKEGFDLAQFFAGAGLVGVAIGVMARDIFIDLFNGANILAEDQFGVGDWIEANGESGEVVAFSLRSTKIRKADGSLATLPNSDLRRVKNHSNEYSVVDFQVTVFYQADTDYALALILEEIALLETEWQGKFTAPPDVLGIQDLGVSGVTLRVTIKTVPLAQWEAHRRLRRRVKLRFDKEGVEFAGARNIVVIQRAPQEEADEPSEGNG